MIQRSMFPFDFQRPETENEKFLDVGGVGDVYLGGAGGGLGSVYWGGVKSITGCIRNGLGCFSSNASLPETGDEPCSGDGGPDVSMIKD